jgi:sucrose phosphorylase
MVAPHVLLLTETNVPHEESASYFGRGDEAHMAYQFTLPPLLLHALEKGDARHLTAWASSLAAPPPGCCYLNFTASHDGIGVRPLEGILPQKEIDDLIDRMRERGGLVSTRAKPGEDESPYELNITYFDAFADPNQRKTELHVARYLCSQILAMSLAGVPAVYFHSLVATENDYGAVRRTGRARTINRAKFDDAVLETSLGNKSTLATRILRDYTRLLRLRGRHPAFHPLGAQRILDLGTEVFACVRTAPDDSETVLVLSNVTAHSVAVETASLGSDLATQKEWKDCIRGRTYNGSRRTMPLHPYQTVWLIPRD